MKKHYLSKFFLIGMMSAALPSQVDAQIKVLFDVAAPKGMTDQEAASQQVLYISNNASLLDDTEYITRSRNWSVAPVVKDGKVLSVSLKRSLYQDGGWGMSVRSQAVDVQRNLGLEAGNTLYYRFYDPRFIKPIKGSAVIAPDAEGYQRISITQMAEAQRVTFQPALDREGNALPIYVAPDLSSSSHTDMYRDRNLVEINPKNNVNADGYNFYVLSGEKVRYAVMPIDAEGTLLAMHVDSVTVGNADLNIETDYRKAVLCRLYVNDAKGNRLNITSSQSLGTAYYNLTPNAPCYGWGCFNKNYFGMGSELSRGTLYVYALPGKQIFQLMHASVENPDADFIFPYNAQNYWLLSDVTIREGVTEQDVVMAQYHPMTVTTTLKNAAKVADIGRFSISHKARIHFPYAGSTKVDYWVTPLATQIKRVGDDIVLTQRFHRADNMEMLSATLDVSRKGNTIADALTSSFVYPEDLASYSIMLSQSNYMSAKGSLDFDKIHKVRVVVPCPYFKESNGEVVWYDEQQIVRLAAGSHADGCSKGLLSEAPYVPNDTLTFLLPEGSFSYKVMNEDGEAVRFGSFVLSNSDETILSPFATNYSLLRVSDADGEHLINVTDGSENYKYESSPIVQLEPTGAEGASEQHVYFSYPVTIPLQPGFNDYTRSYREVKLANAKTLTLWPTTRYIGDDCHYTNLSIPDNAVQSSSKERRIHLPQGQGMLLAACRSISGRNGVQLFDILPSDNDTLLAFPYKENRGNIVTFYYNGEFISTKCRGHNGFNLFYEPAHVRIGFLDDAYAKPYNPWTANRFRLYPGKYQVSGILLMGDEDSYEEVPFGPVSFEVTDKAVSVELNPEYTGIGAVEANESAATIVDRYTIDGRRINHPQSGINLLQMSDGSVRKVVVK